MSYSKSIEEVPVINFNLESEQEVPVSDSRQLHELQLNPRFLRYQSLKTIDGCEIFCTDAVNFPLRPDASVRQRLEKINPDDGVLIRYAKLLLAAEANRELLKLIFEGISNGLSKGTMDIIYRIETPPKVEEVLDNLEIAVGSLQRRVIVSDLIAKTLTQDKRLKSVVSVAGGSCLIPIEGICQSGRQNIKIINIDRSTRAIRKARATIDRVSRGRHLDLTLSHISNDILIDGLGIYRETQDALLFECTGFWEYLDHAQRSQFLAQLSNCLKNNDVLRTYPKNI